MKNFIAMLFPLLLISCNYFGIIKAKNLIDLTPRSKIEKDEGIRFSSKKKVSFLDKKTKSYKLAKHAIIATPAFAKGVMYNVDKEGFVSAFSFKERKLLWSTDIAKGSVERNFNVGGITYCDEKLYVTNSTRYLMVLDAKSGHEIIRKKFPDIVRVEPVMATDRIMIVQTISNQLIAYDIESSKLIWMHESAIKTILTKGHVHPVVHNEHALISYTSGEVLYLDVNTGKEKWSYNISNLNDDIGMPSFDSSVIVTMPIVIDNYAYFATSNNKIIKIDLDNGVPAWLRYIDDVQSMNLVNGVLFITNNARQVVALSSHDGKIIWVGDLISKKNKSSKNFKMSLFQAPFVSKTKSGFAVSVIASNGELYQFSTNESGKLPIQPNILKIPKNIKYYWISCCNGKLHLITNRQIIF